MDRSLSQTLGLAAPDRRGVAAALGLALVLTQAAPAAEVERLAPYVGTRYVNPVLGFSLDLPGRLAACQLPVERWREGIVIVLGAGASCDSIRRVVGFITVSGEPNTEALGDVTSLAASLCSHPSSGAARVEPARRRIAGLETLSCLMQEETGSVVLEAFAQRANAGPPATWTNLRVSLIARGDRWLEFTGVFEDLIARVGISAR